MITGCTYGKGNIKQLNYGKWGVTLIDRASGRAVRVVPKTEAMLANKQSDFFKNYREKGVPASQVPASVVEPLIAKVMGAPDAMLMKIGDVVAHSLPKRVESFAGFVCEVCGEMTVEGYGRPLGDKKVCIPCYEQAAQAGTR
jgi:formylmethanofuran dehydrogenase subunit E